MSACIEAGYRYWHEWQDLDADQQAFLIAYYISKRSVDSHAHDAQISHQEAASKRKK